MIKIKYYIPDYLNTFSGLRFLYNTVIFCLESQVIEVHTAEIPASIS